MVSLGIMATNVLKSYVSVSVKRETRDKLNKIKHKLEANSLDFAINEIINKVNIK